MLISWLANVIVGHCLVVCVHQMVKCELVDGKI